jgi:prefoldin subunit 5
MKKFSMLGKKDIESIVDTRTDKNMSFIDAEIKGLKTTLEMLEKRIQVVEYKCSKIEGELIKFTQEDK